MTRASQGVESRVKTVVVILLSVADLDTYVGQLKICRGHPVFYLIG